MVMLMFCMIFEGMCLLLMLMFMPTLMFCVMQVPADVDVDNVYACRYCSRYLDLCSLIGKYSSKGSIYVHLEAILSYISLFLNCCMKYRFAYDISQLI